MFCRADLTCNHKCEKEQSLLTCLNDHDMYKYESNLIFSLYFFGQMCSTFCSHIIIAEAAYCKYMQ